MVCFPKNTLVVVGTGEGATLFRNVAVGGGIELKGRSRFGARKTLLDQGPAGQIPARHFTPGIPWKATIPQIPSPPPFTDLAPGPPKFEKLGG